VATWTSSRKSSLCQSIVLLELGLPVHTSSVSSAFLGAPDPVETCPCEHQPAEELQREKSGLSKHTPLPISFMCCLGLEEAQTCRLWIFVSTKKLQTLHFELESSFMSSSGSPGLPRAVLFINWCCFLLAGFPALCPAACPE
jgi:hypothetical protein